MSKKSNITWIGKATFHKKSGNHYRKIKLENGESGSLGTRDEAPDWLVKGAEINYTIEESQHGNRIKRVQEYKSGTSNPNNNAIGQAVGNALSNATMLACHDKIDVEEIPDMAKRIVEHSLRIQSEIKSNL